MADPNSQSQPPPNLPHSDQRSGFDRLREQQHLLINLVTQISASAILSTAGETLGKSSIPEERYKSALEEAEDAARSAEDKARSAKDALEKIEEKRSRDATTDAAEAARDAAEAAEKFMDAAEAAEKFMDAAKRVAELAGGVDLSNGEYGQQAETLVEDVKYISRHVESLKSSACSDRADEFLIDLMDAAAKLSVLDFMLVSENQNLKILLKMVAKLKLWIRREKGSGDKGTAGSTKPGISREKGSGDKKKKKGSSFVSRKGTESVAASIAKELFNLKCRQWGMSGLLDAYDSLLDNRKLCLLYFSAFPCESDPDHAVEESLEIKNRILIHLWVGERFIDSNEKKTIEENGEEILVDLTEKGFIEPVVKKGLRTKNGLTGSSRMHPFVHSFVVALAKRAGFLEFGEGGEITAELGRSEGASERACLLKSRGENLSSCQLWRSWTNDTNWRKMMMRFETIQTLFNVDESVIDVKSEWFSKMKHLNVLHLGSWSSGSTENIEVEDQKFLRDVKIMRQLRLLSLQGVSKVLTLPDSVTKLENLVILNLRECRSLRKLPHGIGSLGNLTHLDVTNCHLLTELPKGVRKLSKLQVLKGFVISEAKGAKGCTLKDLKKLKELRELGIVVNRNNFPIDDEVQVFREMSKLRKLRISWEWSFKKEQGNGKEKQESAVICRCIPWKHKPEAQGVVARSRELSDNNESLGQIKELELLRMPVKKAPNWLVPDQLRGLKTLYIKGDIRGWGLMSLPELPRDDPGKFGKWNDVETLRLKYMKELKITWGELREMFPKLKYLECYKCEKLKHFPCDQEGVWKKENELY